MSNQIEIMTRIQKHTLAARAVNPLISVAVEAGRFTVNEVTNQDGGTCDVVDLTAALSLDEAIAYLKEISGESQCQLQS